MVRKAKAEKDPRSQHPAIQAIRVLMARYPNKVLWDDLIEKFGDEPNVERLTECFKAWVARGFKEVNLAWATDWYFTGIPGKHCPQGLQYLVSSVPTPEPEDWQTDDFISWINVQEATLSDEDFSDRTGYEQWKATHLSRRPQDRPDVERYEQSIQFRERFPQTEPTRDSQLAEPCGG